MQQHLDHCPLELPLKSEPIGYNFQPQHPALVRIRRVS